MSEEKNPKGVISSSKLKSKKVSHPTFKRPNVGRPSRKRLEDKWRKPRGIDNKQREKRNKAGALPNIGYRNPKDYRDIHPSGYYEVLITCERDLEKVIDTQGVAVRLASKLGKKKREALVNKINELNLKLLN
jgi:large subunit ribosomal protein L32e